MKISPPSIPGMSMSSCAASISFYRCSNWKISIESLFQKKPRRIAPPGLLHLYPYKHQNGAHILEAECENALNAKRCIGALAVYILVYGSGAKPPEVPVPAKVVIKLPIDM
jgi:hypothetical protein